MTTTHLGIDLQLPGSGDGPNLPQASFPEGSGPNLSQHFPESMTATFDGQNTLVSGDIPGRINPFPITLEFFSTAGTVNPIANRQGKTFIVSRPIPAVPFNDVRLPGDQRGKKITVTATDANGNTSEFSGVLEP